MIKGVRWIILALAILLGTGWQLQEKILGHRDSYLAAAVLGLLGLLILIWRYQRHQTHPSYWMLLVCGLILSWGWSGWRSHLVMAHDLPPPIQHQPFEVDVIGIIASVPQRQDHGWTFTLDAEEVSQDGQLVRSPRLIRLHGFPVHPDGSPPLQPGQRWRMHVSMDAPVGTINPHGFNIERWFFSQGIRAVGRVNANASTHSQPPQLLADTPSYRIERWRAQIMQRIQQHVHDPRSAGVIAGLTIGEQDAIDDEMWNVFRLTGVAHLMSISGLHITLFAWLAQHVISGLWRRSPRCLIQLDAGSAARWAGVVVATGYALMAGWGIPAQRTVWMLWLFCALRQRAIVWPPSISLSLALFALVLFDPWSVTQAGFWLSFVAVAMLMLPNAPQAYADVEAQRSNRSVASRMVHYLREMIRTQWRLTIGLAPLTLIFFQQISLVGLVANLFAIPWVTWVCTPLSLLGVVFPALLPLADQSIQTLADFLNFCLRWKGGVWSIAVAAWPFQLAALMGVALWLSPWPQRIRWPGLLMCVPMLWPAPQMPSPGKFRIVAADVGQGTAVLVQTHRHQLLFDAGPAWGRSQDAGERILVPLLRSLGISALDKLVLSHGDLDHVGGASSLSPHLQIRSLSSSLPLDHPLQSIALRSDTCMAGQQWDWDGVHFEFLHPSPRDLERFRHGYLPPNHTSCVLRISDGRYSALLTGDIEAEEEWALVQKEPQKLRSDWLLVPHHGSRTSSIHDFLKAVQPNTAYIQTGWKNRYGHPAPDVVARYESHHIQWHTSIECGAMLWQEGKTHCERPHQQRFWSTRPQINTTTPAQK